MMDNSVVGDGVPDVPNWLAKNQDNFTDDLLSYLCHLPSPSPLPQGEGIRIKIFLLMIYDHIYAINPHPDPLPQGEGILNQDNFTDDLFSYLRHFPLTLTLSHRARVSLPMMDNSFVGDGVLDVPYWLAKNQDNFTDDLFSYLRHLPSP